MAINKKLIHFKKEASFKPELDSGNILQTSIVFIQDTKKIWTHGQYYNYDDSTILEKINSLTKNDVGLGNVDNTSDTNKPVSTAQAAAIKVVQDDLTHLDQNLAQEIKERISADDTKVDKITGKGLSTNDFTDEYKGILDNPWGITIK